MTTEDKFKLNGWKEFEGWEELGEMGIKDVKIITIEQLKEEISKLAEIARREERLNEKYYTGYHDALREMSTILASLNSKNTNKEDKK